MVSRSMGLEPVFALQGREREFESAGRQVGRDATSEGGGASRAIFSSSAERLFDR
jgi:hypothetical protein